MARGGGGLTSHEVLTSYLQALKIWGFSNRYDLESCGLPAKWAPPESLTATLPPKNRPS